MRNYVGSIILIILLLILPNLILGTSWSSPNNAFNVTPDELSLNWSNSYQSTITLGMNSSYSGVLKIWNNTNTISPNYGQPQSTSYPNLDACGFNPGTFLLYVVNSTGVYTQNTTFMSGGEERSMTLVGGMEESCPPGRYWGYVNITNSTNPNEYFALPVTINIPISENNELNTTTGIGSFKGILPANANTYHSYYFNTSSIDNSTGVTIKLSWSGSSDVDLFLFDSNGNLKAKSINTGQSESLNYNYLPKNEVWEIRLYGNSSSSINYQSSGQVLFTTLNATNASNPSQQFSFIDLGEMNVSDRKNIKIKLENEGNLILNSVYQSSELYHVQTLSDSSPRNFSVRVPNFVTKIRAEVTWTNGANYTLTLYNSNNVQIDTSTNKYTNAGVVGAPKEEYVEYDPTGTIGTSSDGLWKVEIRNNTQTTGPYNLTIKEWIDTSGWISTNYTTMTFNSSGQTNDSTIVDFNFTIQNLTLSGIYRGLLRYTTNEGAVLEIPFMVNITTAELFVNNDFYSSSIQTGDNTGFNKTITFNITINNTGNKEIVFEQDSSSQYLNYSSHYMEFSYDYPNTISPGNSSTLDITIIIDTTKTNNAQGVYRGWILLNDTNSHPHSTFNLSISVNLTNELNVFLRDIFTSDDDKWIEVPSNSENFTIKAEVFYVNGSEIKDLGLANFGSIYLKNKNYTSYRIPTSGFLSTSLYSPPIFKSSDDRYWINISLPGSSSRPGGYYDIYLSTNKSVSGATLLGTTHNGTLIINQSALYFTSVSGIISITEGTTGSEHFNLTITNYGPLEATGSLTLDWENDCSYINDVDPVSYKSGCGSKSGDGFAIQISEGEVCWYTFRFDAENVSSDQSCDIDVLSDAPALNSIEARVDIENLESTGTSDNQQQQQTTETQETEEETKVTIKDYPESLEIVQGESKSFEIKVENEGDTDQTKLKLSITGIPETWYSFTPTELDLNAGEYDEFSVNITPSKTAPIKLYDIVFKVSNNDINITKTSTLRVLPSEEEKIKINETYEKYLGNYTSLEEKLNELLLKNYNVTELNNTLKKIKSKLNSVKNSLSKGDYFSATQTLSEVESLLLQANNLIEEAKPIGGVGILLSGDFSKYIWIIVGVVAIVIIGVLVYLLLPPKEEYRVKASGLKHIKYRSPSELPIT